MSRLLRVTNPAQQDLEEIWLNLEAFGGLELADRPRFKKSFCSLNSFQGWGERGRIWLRASEVPL